jgi:hypothetical protein
VKEPDFREEKNGITGKEGLTFETVPEEPLSNEQADQLATLFAQALVRKLLRKGSNNDHPRSDFKG